MRLRALITALACALLWLGLRDAAFAGTPEEALRAHFAAIVAEDYKGADSYFSQAFLRAFKADVTAMNTYYSTRKQQLAPGYKILESTPLSDPDRETMRVTVDFLDPDPNAIMTVTERIYYYLIREKAPDGSPGRDKDGRAWRIDIYDQVSFDTLAAARRRPYLATQEAWPEDEGRELRSKQGLFRIQWAIAGYHDQKGFYPDKISGGSSRREELIHTGFLQGGYPENGFNGGVMQLQDFGERSAGDFAYYPIDTNKDGRADDYWLTLHGKVPEHYYFTGKDCIYVCNSEMVGTQAELAQQFADFWEQKSSQKLELTSAVEPSVPASALLPQPDVRDSQAAELSEAQKQADAQTAQQGQDAGDSSDAPAPDKGTETSTADVDDSAAGSDNSMSADGDIRPALPENAGAEAVVDEPVSEGNSESGAAAPGSPSGASSSDPAGLGQHIGLALATRISRILDMAAGPVPRPKPRAILAQRPEDVGPWHIFSFGW